MADIAYYREKFGISTEDKAFEKFVDTLANYFDAAYYVDWDKVLANARKHAADFALLSTLCGKPDIEMAAIDLFMRNPHVIRALPVLIANRRELSLAGSTDAGEISHYSFAPSGSTPPDTLTDAKRYAAFLARSGLIKVLEGIKNVSDYATGVEVGLDSNARKNRGGKCGIQAILPFIAKARARIAKLVVAQEASYDRLKVEGFALPPSCRGIVWDFGFWTHDARDSLVVMEVNHYASTGSKPPAIAREYSARHAELAAAGIGFVWVTDGLGWKRMVNPLRSAFAQFDYLVNVSLASQGLLEFALRSLLLRA